VGGGGNVGAGIAVGSIAKIAFTQKSRGRYRRIVKFV
jgi:hypothetical protein